MRTFVRASIVLLALPLLAAAPAWGRVQVHPLADGTFRVVLQDDSGVKRVLEVDGAVAGGAGEAEDEAAREEMEEAQAEALEAYEEAIEDRIEAHIEAVEEVADRMEEEGEAGAAVPPVPPLPPLPPIPELSHLPPDLQERVRERVQRAEERAEHARRRMEHIQARVAEAHARSSGRGDDDLVAAGNSITVPSGEVVRDVVAMGGTVTVMPGAVVRGDAVALGGTVDLQPGAVVEGDAVALGGSVVVRTGAVVRGDASSFGGSIEVEEGGIVEGDRVGMGPGKVFGHIKDVATDKEVEVHVGPSDEAGFGAVVASLLFKTVQFIAVAVLGLIFLAAMPRRMDRMQNALGRQKGKALLVGLLTVLAFVPLTILLAITLVGIAAIPLLILAYVAAFFVGWAVAGMEMGRQLKLSRPTPAINLLLGIAVFWGLALLSEIPIFGWIPALALVVATLMGLGSVVLARFGNQPRVPGEAHPPTTYAEDARTW